MSTVTVRFRGICCFADPVGDAKFKKRVLVPKGDGHHAVEKHNTIIECFADDIPTDLREFEGIPKTRYTRLGDDARYVSFGLDGSEVGYYVEVLGANTDEPIVHARNYHDGVVRLQKELVPEGLQLKRSLLDDDPRKMASPGAAMIFELPGGELIAGPPEPAVTEFTEPGFRKRRMAKWIDVIVPLKGENLPFGLRLTPLGEASASSREIFFNDTTRLITIANEPERHTLGMIVREQAEDRPAQTEGHFIMYYDLFADPLRKPVPVANQGLGSSSGCSPTNIP